MAELNEVDLTSIPQRREKGSVFICYGTSVINKSQIRKLYQHLKLKHAEATHITLAYRLSGLDKAYDEGAVDDGEHGLGRRLLQFLVKEDKVQVAVFSVRFYGGQKLFENRFNIPMQMCAEVFSEMQKSNTANSVSKLHLKQIEDRTRTVKPRRGSTSWGKVSGRRASTGASPQLGRGGHQQNTVRRFLSSLSEQAPQEEDSDTYTCPTSATSETGRGTEDEDYLSIPDDRRGLDKGIQEDWSTTGSGEWDEDVTLLKRREQDTDSEKQSDTDG